MLKTINTKSNTVVIVAVLATVMLIGRTVSGAEVFAQKYKNWEGCRDDHSKKWCKNYFKHHDDDDDDGDKVE
jgi:hypothetical protein